MRTSSAEANFIPTSFTTVNFHVVSMCLPSALKATGKQSVSRCPTLAESGWPGCNRSDGGGSVISGETQQVSRCTGPGLRAGRGRQRLLHLSTPYPFLQYLVQRLTIDAPIAYHHGLFVSMQYCAPLTTLQCQRTRDLDPLRRRRLERDQFWSFQGCFLRLQILR